MKTLKSVLAIALALVVTGCASLEPSSEHNDIASILSESSQYGGH